MNLSRSAIRRPNATLILFASLLIFGLIALTRMRLDLFPEIEYPTITVVTTLDNKSPQEIRDLITVPMEEMLSTLSGLRSVQSVSRYDESVLTLSFDWGVNMDLIYMETREKLDQAKSILPQGTTRPVALRFDPNGDPVMMLSINFLNTSQNDNEKSFIRKNIKPLFERIDGVSYVDTVGGSEQEVVVEADLASLYSRKVSLDEIIKSIQDNNLEYPVGEIVENKKSFSVRIEGKITDYRDLENLVIGRNEEGTPVYLKSVATVRLTQKEPTLLFRQKGREGAAIAIYKEGDANIVRTVQNIKEKLPQILKRFENDVSFTVLSDQAGYIEHSITDISMSAIIGMLLAFVVLYLFLEDALSSAIVSLAIPVSVILTIFVMYLFNISVNLISLTGMSHAVGMMVDANIVVIENIKKRQARDDSSLIAAVDQVMPPNVTAVLTNVAVFMPIVFVQGIASAVFRELSIVVTAGMLCSLLTSITLTPALYKVLSKKVKTKNGSHKSKFNTFFENLTSAYEKLLEKALIYPGKIAAGMLVLTVLSICLLVFVKKEVLPNLIQKQLVVRMLFPPDNSLDKTAESLSFLEKRVAGNKAVANYYSVAGNFTALSGVSKSRRDNSAVMTVLLKNGYSPQKEIPKIEKDLSDAGGGNVRLRFEENQSAFARLLGSENRISLMGTPYEYLKSAAEEVGKILAQKGATNLASSTEEQETLSVNFDPQALNNSGLDTRQVSSIAEAALNGKAASKYSSGEGEETDIRVRLDKNLFLNREDFGKIMIKNPEGENILLSDIASIRSETKVTEMNRKNQQELISWQFDPGKASLNSIMKAISKLQFARNIQIEASWDSPETRASILSLMLALALSIVVIFVIIAFQFESVSRPFMIILSIPLVFVGVAPVLTLTGISLNVISLLGIIMLAGIVVNNGIMLVDYYERAERTADKKGLRKVIIEGSIRRFRPIIMTGLVTLISLLPLIFYPGEGMEYQRIMSITIGSGFLFSTAITLFLIPVLYNFWAGRKYR